jgi:hypothetical protein
LTVPLGSDVIAKVSGAGLITSVTGPVVVSAVGLLESVAFTVIVVVPGNVGVPLIVQFEIVSPAGSVPAVITHVYGGVPPITPISPVYGTFTVPGGGEVIVSDPAGLIVILTGPVVEFLGLLESVAVIVMFDVPATVGVPLTRHPAIDSSAGNAPPTTTQL